MSSLFGQYIRERQNKEIVEDERGFCTYFYLKDGVYIEDLYVKPDHRQAGVASSYADKVAELAKAKGFNKMYGSVALMANHSTSSLKVLLAYGFQLDSAHNNSIILVKDI